MKKLVLGLTSLSLLASACAPTSQNAGNLVSQPQIHARLLAPVPTELLSERAQLSRFRGQSSFLNPEQSYHDGPTRSGAKSDQAGAPESAQQRTEQESDVFKIGRPGSKLLYLLNSARGLQVVSFAGGEQNPKLMGRVAPTGNTATEMYFDSNRERLIVLEGRYDSESDSHQSRLLIYNVKNPEAPSIVSAVNVNGQIADSRIVGDVLYIAATNAKKGFVASYALKRQDLAQVQRQELVMPVSGAENMNIVTVPQANGGFKYFLMATLSESGWGWFDRESRVEVIDISDERGQIKAVMSVAAKGVVRERSQTLIKNDTLVVTSNYFVGEGRARIARIAVETYRFPTAESEVISDKEALRRKLNIEKKLEGLSGKEYQEAYDKLAADAKDGVLGRFIREDNGALKKMMPDSSVTVGDGSGLSANLQDVRYQDDLLYAFWVPANEIDPFDLFDISQPEKGVKYLSRLQFDGWIARAVPLKAGNRRFVLGLGWVVPVVNNEQRRRQPQVMLFEITENRGKLRPLDIAQLTLEGSDIWSNFNGQDKEIEVRVDAEGKGEILFKASRYDRTAGKPSWDEGGQIVRFDLSAVLAERYQDALKQGPFLGGGADWVRRVFTNSEIGRINSFSDRALATFGAANPGDTGVLSPVSLLELARNLVAFETLKNEGKTYGVQLISDTSYYGSSQKAETVLRSVKAERADEEKAGVLSEAKLEGSYVSHLVDQRTGELLVLTTRYDQASDARGDQNWKSIYVVSRIAIAQGGALQNRGSASWSNDEVAASGHRMKRRWRPVYRSSESALVQLASGQVLAQADSSLALIDTSEVLKATKVAFDGCGGLKERTEIEVQILNGHVYLSSKARVELQEARGLEATRNFIAKAELTGSVLKCQAEMNIPGQVIAVTKQGALMVRDQWAQDIIPGKPTTESAAELATGSATGHAETVQDEFLLKSSLLSLKVESDRAVLVDENQSASALDNALPIDDGRFVRLSKAAGSSSHQVEFMSLDGDARFESEVFSVNLELGTPVGRTRHGYSYGSSFESTTISRLARLSTPGSYLALVRDGAKVQVLGWSAQSKRPEVKTIALVDERFEKKAAGAVANLPESYSYGVAKPHFNLELLSFEIPHGLAGVSQILVQQ